MNCLSSFQTNSRILDNQGSQNTMLTHLHFQVEQ